MKMTLLEIVQDTLSSMDSDGVNSISDTVEAVQVADLVKEAYYEIINRKDWEFLKKLRELEAVSDEARPNYLKLPVNVSEVYWIKYDVTEQNDFFTKHRELIYLSPKDFVEKCLNRDDSQANVQQVEDFNSVVLNIYNDRPPTYWTTFDDEYIVTDSFDSVVEDTHQSSKSLMHCAETPNWTTADAFVPSLPSKMFPLLLSEAKVAAHFFLKQMNNQIDAQRSNRHSAIQLQSEYRANARKKVNFGRR